MCLISAGSISLDSTFKDGDKFVMRAIEKDSWELVNKEKRFGFGNIVGNKTEFLKMTLACCSPHSFFLYFKLKV